MRRPLAILLTLAIVFGTTAGIALLTVIFTSGYTATLVGSIFGFAFGTFAPHICLTLLTVRGSVRAI